ncbi:nucleoside monophosphate kinase [Nocardia huaxiensis]|uniref:Adenylate kinase n=1 Tax=Nocardia huaxiensis TaxID=2755382 RepID=A0A7D6Z9M4_9NOCA|nr:nucleoside monophosphate kinase [Nocardia huaxiensis]QLY28398.1 nucleoside monophosphate kinase [Nocardia huaxiensis]
MRLMMSGPLGSGAAAQQERVAEHWRIPAIDLGVAVRAEIDADTALGRRAIELFDRGAELGDALPVDMLLSHLDRVAAEQGFLLAGLPSSVPQAELLTRRLMMRGTPLRAVVLLDEPAEQTMARVAARAGFDASAADGFRERFALYESTQRPVLEFYRDHARQGGIPCYTVPVTGDADEVFARIVDALE